MIIRTTAAVLLLCCLWPTGQLGAQPVTAGEFLDAAEASTRWIARSAQTIHLEYAYSTAAAADRAFRTVCTIQRFQLDKKLHFKVQMVRFDAAGTRQLEVSREHITLDDAHVLYPPSTKQLQWTQNPSRVQEWRQADLSNALLGGHLDGMIYTCQAGPQSIFDLARAGQTRLLDDTVRVQDLDCRLIESKTPLGVLRIWIAPSRDYGLAQYELDGRGISGVQCKSFHAMFSRAAFSQIGGKWLLAGGRFDIVTVLPDGQTQTEQINAERRQIDLDPQFDQPGLFSTAHIPDGSRVINEDNLESGLRYVWEKGRVVPLADSETIRQIRQEIEKYRSQTRQSPAVVAALQPADQPGQIQPATSPSQYSAAETPWPTQDHPARKIRREVAAGIVVLVICGAAAALMLGRYWKNHRA